MKMQGAAPEKEVPWNLDAVVMVETEVVAKTALLDAVMMMVMMIKMVETAKMVETTNTTARIQRIAFPCPCRSSLWVLLFIYKQFRIQFDTR